MEASANRQRLVQQKEVFRGEWLMRYGPLSVFIACAVMALPVQAQVPAEVDACRLSGLVALKERSPAIKDLTFDIDGLAISKADTKVEDTRSRW